MRTKSLDWRAELAYAIGLFVADGHLSIDGRHLDFTSKDEKLVQTFKESLGIQNPIAKKTRSTEKEKRYFHVGFSDVRLYNFLISIGIPQQKTFHVGKLKISKELFADFLRGLIDGDGNINIVKHPESSHGQIKIRIFSGSKRFLEWVNNQVLNLGIRKGKLRFTARVWELIYYKRESLEILKMIYYSDDLPCLERKYITAKNCLEANKTYNPLRWGNRFTVNN